MKPNKEKYKKYRFLRRLARIFLGLILFLLLLVLFIRSPWGQDIIVQKAVNYVANKTNTKVELEKLFIAFDGSIQLEKLYLEDTKGDTLVYSKSLEANIPLWATITGKTYGIDNLKWEGLRVNIIRKDSIKGYNFQFLIDAFATENKTNTSKDTITSSPEIVIGTISLKEINLDFKDAVLGIDSKFKIGSLKTGMETVNLDKMIFDVNEISLKNSNIKFTQKLVKLKTTKDQPQTSLPILSVNAIIAQNLKINYNSEINNLIADATIGDFYTEIPNLNLVENKFKLNIIELKNSEITLKTKTDPKPEQKKTATKNSLIWPDVVAEIDEINIENNKVNYFVNNATSLQTNFNPNAIALNNLNIKAQNIFLKDKKAGAELSTFNFTEKSGFNLEAFQLNANITDNNLNISDIYIGLDKSKISGFLKVNYNSLSELIATPEKTKVQLNLQNFQILLTDAFQFQPALKQNKYLQKLSKKLLKGALDINGSLANLNINKAKVNWGSSTKININGFVKNPTNLELLVLSFPNFKIETKRTDLLKVVNEKELGIKLPEEILITGNVSGTLQNIETNAKIKTTQGFASIIASFKKNENIAYNLAINTENYNIGSLLKNEQFGALSLNIKSKGNGIDINNLEASLNANVSKFIFNNYEIKDLEIEGNIKNGIGNFVSNYKDDNLNFNLKSNLILDSIFTKANLNLDIIGADLQGLGLLSRNIKTGMEISLDFKGNADTYVINSNIKNGVFVYDNRTYLVGNVFANAFVAKDTTAFKLQNKMVDLNLESNADPLTFSTSIKKHIFSYFYRDTKLQDAITKPVILKLKGKISQTALIKDVFLVNIKDLDTINIDLDFNEKGRKLKANITAPHINYADNKLDSLAFSMNTNKDSFNFNLGFKNITAGPLNVPKTLIKGYQKDNQLKLNFAGFSKGETLMNVNAKITGEREELKFMVASDSLILNKRIWQIPESNKITLTDNKLLFTDFKILKKNQSIEITNNLQEVKNNHIAIDYKNFKIEEIFNYLNPDTEIATGILNGVFVLEKPFTETGILAELSIKNLEILKTKFGVLNLDAKSLGDTSYDFNASLKEGFIDLDLNGEYTIAENDANLNLNLIINEFKMNALNTLSLGEIKDAKGSFSSIIKVQGKLSEPQYKGDLKFTNADFNIAKLNTLFTLKNETLEIDNAGFKMSKFTVLDAQKNALILDGNIKTKNFFNPEFNLKLRANNFRVLNATKQDNPSLYGKAFFNANANLSGDLQIPKLDVNVTLGANTNVTYVMPKTYANLEEREGVVVFVNRKNPDAILTQTQEKKAIVTGFDVKANIKIDKKAKVIVVINEETGDNFRASGEGSFIFTMIPNGRITFTGGYEIAEGHYELNLYNLVNKRFIINAGSKISWSGDPFDADLDVSASYKLETSASPLMASQISGEDVSVRNKFKQVLPFNVYLNIDGQLLKPKISFNLDMPEEEQGAIGGQVYSRVQQVNQQEDELNRQVFSLLVLNRFYPDSGSDGSSGGFATIARNNLNDAVSGQLNAFSEKVLGNSGVELDFGLNSFTDYQGDAPTDRTQLDIAAQKKLFNDRLTVRVGSEVDIQGSSSLEENAPLIGNVSLEYRVTEDGRYRIRGFRKSEFENIIDGQTIVSGLSLVFTKEFNTFKQLWIAIFESQKEVKEKLKTSKKLAEENRFKKEKEATKNIQKIKN